jgi:DtxR family Mn-dependent transcriptional regulator
MKKSPVKKLSSSLEDYLEAILMLQQKHSEVRVSDISQFLSVRKSSVTGALKVLADKGMVVHKRYGKAVLTGEGSRIAEDIAKKHKFLSKFFSSVLGVSAEIAAEDACKIEHTISPEGFERLTKFLEFIKQPSKRKKPEWLEKFHCYCVSSKTKGAKMKKKKSTTDKGG